MKKNILNVEVSKFKNAKSTMPETVKLYDWLISKSYEKLVASVRTCKDEKKKKELKEKLPCITPSGTFKTRGANNLINHSGFICIDIDKKDNDKLKDFDKMKDLIKVLDCVAYCSLSVSGKGFFVLIPISNPDKHKEHFESLKIDFESCEITIDNSCSDISRLRFASYDEFPYINMKAVPYNKIISRGANIQIKNQIVNNSETTRKKVNKLISEIEFLGIDITGNYDDWFSIGCSIASEFGESGRNIFHTVSENYHKYTCEETDKKYTDCLNIKNKEFSIGTLFHYANKHKIKFENNN